MSLLQFSGLFVVWLLCTLFIATLTWFEFRRVRFNFNVFFSLLFLLTFFFGFPLTSVLVFRFDVGVAPPEILLQALLSAGCFYAVYYVTYKTRLRKRVADAPRRPLFTMNRVETNLTWVILMGIALVSVGIFFMHNGFLLFRLNSYSQIFSSEVSGVALKRFFYFFIPAMLVVYFLRQDSKAWLFFLVSTVAFGLLTYMIVGGTRANIIIAFAIFLFIGIIRGWISLWMLAAAGVLFWFADSPYAGVAAIFLFNMSMPMTLCALARRMPGCKGFSFGLLTFALFLGFLPVGLGAVSSSPNWLLASLCALSALLMLPGLDGRSVSLSHES